LRAVDDPRDAAAVLMLLVARAHGDPTREQIAAIENKLREVFGFERELTERMTHARFIARHAETFSQAAAIFAPLFKQRLSFTERGDLIDMLEEVAPERGTLRGPGGGDCLVQTADRARAGPLSLRRIVPAQDMTNTTPIR
jgi:uncharacterized tellurite resistance protein B-like protein